MVVVKMSSSIKPPLEKALEKNTMKPIRKFQFDADFDAEAEFLRVEEERRVCEQETVQETEEVAIPSTPSFDEDQLRHAQRESFEKGLQQGREDMRLSLENTANLVLDHIAIKLEGMASEQEKQALAAQELAVRTSAATLKKCWPQIVQHLGLDNIEKTIRQAMEYNAEEMRIVVRVHDTMLDAIVERLYKIQAQQAFAGKVIVLSDDSVVAGDCKIEWADGGMERLGRMMTAQLDRALERILAGLSQPPAVQNQEIESNVQIPEMDMPPQIDLSDEPVAEIEDTIETHETHESDTERTSS